MNSSTYENKFMPPFMPFIRVAIVSFIIPICLWYPVANNERFTWMYTTPAKAFIASLKILLEKNGLHGAWSIAFGLIITGLTLSFIAVTAIMLGNYFFRSKKTLAFISDTVLVFFPYWGVTTFYLFNIIKENYLLVDVTAFNGSISLMICKVLLPFICLSMPLSTIGAAQMNLIETPIYLFANESSYLNFKTILRTLWSWTKRFVFPWVAVALAMIHMNVFI